MPTATATISGHTLAETSTYETVEGNIYFPPSSLASDVDFKETNTQTSCPWKGDASYYSVTVDGKETKDAAWFYPKPKSKAENIRGYVAFYQNKVKVSVS